MLGSCSVENLLGKHLVKKFEEVAEEKNTPLKIKNNLIEKSFKLPQKHQRNSCLEGASKEMKNNMRRTLRDNK